MNNTHIPHEPHGDPAQNGTGGANRKTLIALPVQLIETEGGAILKRGCVEIKIGGDRAIEAIQAIFGILGDGASTAEAIEARFAAPDRPAIQSLLKELISRRMVVESDAETRAPLTESNLDVFYWHFGTTAADVNERLNGIRLVIVGVNHISRQLAGALAAAGVSDPIIVDYPLLRNLAFFDDAGSLRDERWNVSATPVPYDAVAERLVAGEFDCLVATADFGGLQSMREWNELCVAKGRHFLPIVLQDMIGYVGPSVIPGETACFECLMGRLNSHRDNGPIDRYDGRTAYTGQLVAGFHPSMASVLGDLAAIELTKFYSRSIPFWKVGSLTEVNLLAGTLNTRKVLMVPRCRVCSTMIHRSSTSIIKGSVASEVIDK